MLLLRHRLRTMLRRVFAAVHQEFLNGNMEGARKAENRTRLAVLQPHAAAEQIAQGSFRNAALPGKFRLGQALGTHQLI